MRITGGRLRGRVLRGHVDKDTRPTPERVREALASRLGSLDVIAGAHVLELYAGTGAFGIEMLSRGASHVTFVESKPAVSRTLRQTLESLALTSHAKVIPRKLSHQGTALQKALATGGQAAPFTMVFLDPPYRDLDDALLILSALRRGDCLAQDALCIVEHASRDTVPEDPANPHLSHARYGDTAVTIMRHRKG